MDKVYLIQWHSGDSSQVYRGLTDAINALQYHRGREADLFIIDIDNMSVEQHYIPLCN